MNQARKRRCRSRRGNAVIELVVGIPILFLLTFGSIEASNLNHLQHCATEASWQGGLSGMAFASSESRIISKMEAMLQAHGIVGSTITVAGLDGTPFDDLVSGDRFRVTTTIPAPPNLPMLCRIVSLPDLVSDRVAQKP